jgi:hypothetical protein
MEVELALAQEQLEFSEELATEDTAQEADGQEEPWGCGDPSGSIERQAACGNDAMDMGMVLEVLPPGVRNAE